MAIRKKLQDILKGKKIKQFEKTEQVSEPDSDMAGILELPNWKFKTTMINTVRALIK